MGIKDPFYAHSLKLKGDRTFAHFVEILKNHDDAEFAETSCRLDSVYGNINQFLT
jgi:hypothetical protein